MNAMKKFMSLERTLHKSPELFKKQSAVVQKCLSVGHLEKIPPVQLDTRCNIFIVWLRMTARQ